MKKLWEKFQLNRRLKSCIKKTVNEQDPDILVSFLKENPKLSTKIADIALREATYNPWKSIWLCLGLIQIGNKNAVEILKRIVLESDFIGWDRIEEQYAQMILTYLGRNNCSDLIAMYAEKLKLTDFRVVIEFIETEQFKKWISNYLKDKTVIPYVFDSIVKLLDDIVFNRRSISHQKRALANIYVSALEIWNSNDIDTALKILKLVLLIKPDLVDQEVLSSIAESLSLLVPKKPKIDVKGDNQFLNQLSQIINEKTIVPQVPQGITHGADILRLFPSEDWIDDLKITWIYISEYIRIAYRDSLEKGKKQVPLSLLMAGNAVISALGICISTSEGIVEIESEDEMIKEAMKMLENNTKTLHELIREHQNLVEQYVEQYHSLSNSEAQELKEKIRDLSSKIRELRDYNEDKFQEVQLNLSPIQHLLNVLTNEQDYPDELRQSAAWTLYHIIKRVKLKSQDRKKIEETLQAAILNEDKSSINPEFAERVIHIFPDASLLEFEFHLADGLNWMVDMMEGRENLEFATVLKSKFKQRLHEIVILLNEHLSQVISFFSHYPLRLMNLDHHRRILGKYVKKKFSLTFWTRYTPPPWKPGMPPEEAGEVHKRFLTLDDRSTPNSMGIYYRLFEHPVLCLPVLYHEFLHYTGISNESEVWLRETIFMQYLIARLSPKDENKIPIFEAEIVNIIKQLNLPGLGLQIQWNLSDSNFLEAFCDVIESIYGKQIGKDEALRKVNEQIEYENRFIHLMNTTDEEKLNWYPDIEWPYLDSEETRELTEQYKSILFKSMITNHRLSYKDFRKIMNEESVQRQIREWEKYKNRKFAMSVFDQNWKIIYIDHKVLSKILDRFQAFNIASLWDLLVDILRQHENKEGFTIVALKQPKEDKNINR